MAPVAAGQQHDGCRQRSRQRHRRDLVPAPSVVHRLDHAAQQQDEKEDHRRAHPCAHNAEHLPLSRLDESFQPLVQALPIDGAAPLALRLPLHLFNAQGVLLALQHLFGGDGPGRAGTQHQHHTQHGQPPHFHPS